MPTSIFCPGTNTFVVSADIARASVDIAPDRLRSAASVDIAPDRSRPSAVYVGTGDIRA
jgi:hypothetical protein